MIPPFAREAELRKVGCWIAGVMAALVIVVLLVWGIVAGPVTVYRVLRYGDTTIDDFRDYPFRRLRASTQPRNSSRFPSRLLL